MKYIKGLNLFKKQQKNKVEDNILRTKNIMNIDLSDIEDMFIMGTNGSVSISKKVQSIGDITYTPGVYTHVKQILGDRFCSIAHWAPNTDEEEVPELVSKLVRKSRVKVRDGIVITINFESVYYDDILKDHIPDADDNLEGIEFTRMWPFNNEIDDERDDEIINLSKKVVKKYKNTELYGIYKTYGDSSKKLQYRIAITAKPL